MADIKRIEIKASRWPWQRRTSMAALSDPKSEGVGMKYGWRQTDGMGRFGGGWNWKFGIDSGGWRGTGITILLNLIFGTVTVHYRTSKGIAQELHYQQQREDRQRAREERARHDESRRHEARERDRTRAEIEAARRAALTPEQRAAEDELPF